MNWLTTEAVEVLEIVEQPVEDRQQEYMVGTSAHRLLHEVKYAKILGSLLAYMSMTENSL